MIQIDGQQKFGYNWSDYFNITAKLKRRKNKVDKEHLQRSGRQIAFAIGTPAFGPNFGAPAVEKMANGRNAGSLWAALPVVARPCVL